MNQPYSLHVGRRWRTLTSLRLRLGGGLHRQHAAFSLSVSLYNLERTFPLLHRYTLQEREAGLPLTASGQEEISCTACAPASSLSSLSLSPLKFRLFAPLHTSSTHLNALIISHHREGSGRADREAGGRHGGWAGWWVGRQALTKLFAPASISQGREEKPVMLEEITQNCLPACRGAVGGGRAVACMNRAHFPSSLFTTTAHKTDKAGERTHYAACHLLGLLSSILIKRQRRG